VSGSDVGGRDLGTWKRAPRPRHERTDVAAGDVERGE
jgi:hypothetical protein